ncbi:unnamed protein product [Darwinula stevensoni]|uniref:Uncharacterized protein n=1 Tax=Darwinula stevensoni TaxID=69355 RepID=A0A7R9A3R9_9CRUS|nr:unnamed protein product [Darwinula stevensoni]CAG0891165.1 unnamed protein product [Darwinula stevensoni]
MVLQQWKKNIDGTVNPDDASTSSESITTTPLGVTTSVAPMGEQDDGRAIGILSSELKCQTEHKRLSEVTSVESCSYDDRIDIRDGLNVSMGGGYTKPFKEAVEEYLHQHYPDVGKTHYSLPFGFLLKEEAFQRLLQNSNGEDIELPADHTAIATVFHQAKNICAQMEKSLCILTPEQKNLVDEDERISWLLLISGGSGTGKTIVVKERAIRLAKGDSEAEVIVVNIAGGRLTEDFKRDFQGITNVTVLDGREDNIPENREGVFSFLRRQGENKHVLLDEVPLTLGMQGLQDERRLSEYWAQISSIKEVVKSLTFAFRPNDSAYGKDINIQGVKIAGVEIKVLKVVKRNTRLVSNLFLALGDYSRRIFICQEPTMRDLEFAESETELLPTLFPIPSCATIHESCNNKLACEAVRSCQALLAISHLEIIKDKKQLYVVVDSRERRNFLMNTFRYIFAKNVKFIDSRGKFRGTSEDSYVFITEDQIHGYHQEDVIVILDQFECNWRNYLRMISSCYENVIITMEEEGMETGKYSSLKFSMPNSIGKVVVPKSTREIFDKGLEEALKTAWTQEEHELTFFHEKAYHRVNHSLIVKENKFQSSQVEKLYYNGMRSKPFIVIFGPPSSGKSTFLLESIGHLVQDRQEKERCILFHMGSVLTWQVSLDYLQPHANNLDLVKSATLLPEDIIYHSRVDEVRWKCPDAIIYIHVDDYSIQAKTTQDEINLWKDVLDDLKNDELKVMLRIAFQSHSRSGREISLKELESFFKKEGVEVVKLPNSRSSCSTSNWLLGQICKNETHTPLRLEAKSLPTASRPGALVHGLKPKIFMKYHCPGQHMEYTCKGHENCMPYITGFFCFRFALAPEVNQVISEREPVHVLVSDEKLIPLLKAMNERYDGRLELVHPKDFRGCESSAVVTLNVEDSWLLESISRARTSLFIIDCMPEHQIVWRTMEEEGWVNVDETTTVDDTNIDLRMLVSLNKVGEFLQVRL